MARPVTLFTGQWADLPLEELAPLAKEMGYDDQPASRFMQLQNQLLSAVRVIHDVRLSLGKMSWEDSVESLIDYMGMDRICAEAEARR